MRIWRFRGVVLQFCRWWLAGWRFLGGYPGRDCKNRESRAGWNGHFIRSEHRMRCARFGWNAICMLLKTLENVYNCEAVTGSSGDEGFVGKVWIRSTRARPPRRHCRASGKIRPLIFSRARAGYPYAWSSRFTITLAIWWRTPADAW